MWRVKREDFARTRDIGHLFAQGRDAKFESAFEPCRSFDVLNFWIGDEVSHELSHQFVQSHLRSWDVLFFLDWSTQMD